MFNYKIEEDHENCLKLYHHLLDAFYECESYAAKYLNLVSIFFPILMRIITGYLLNAFDFNNLKIRNSFSKDKLLRTFPYIKYNLNLPNKRNLMNIISRISIKKKRIAFVGIGENMKFIIKRVIYYGCWPVFPYFARIHIPNYQEQMKVLEGYIKKIIKLFDLEVNVSDIINLLDKLFSPFLNRSNERIKFDLLVTGTLQEINSRILAAKARSHNITVVTLSHGEGDQLIVDEPRIGYGEMTYPNIFIGYGEKGKDIIRNSKFLKSLYEIPKFVPSNSNICKKIYNPSNKIKKFSQIINPTYMYVPTSFVDHLRYGPFHSMPDEVYLEWQKIISRIFPNAIYKRHPKLFKFDVPFKEIIETNFQNCFELADVFIFDVIATAFNIAAATAKPIIFFDLGIRNIHPQVISLLKRRCIWINARQNKSIEYLKSEIEKQSEKSCTNDYTEKYCIINSNINRENTIVSVIKKIMNISQ